MSIIRILLISIIIFTSNYLYASEVSDNWMTNNTFFSRKIYIKKGMVTTIQFSSIIKYFLVGDELITDAKAVNDYTILLSPRIANEQTNLNITTEEGNFVFVIQTLDYLDKQEPNLHINVGKLAGGSLAALNNKIKRDKKESKFNPSYDYHFSMFINPSFPFKTITNLYCHIFHCRFKNIAPRNIWTDGKYTYLDFRTDDGTLRTTPIVQEVVDGIDVSINNFPKQEKIAVSSDEQEDGIIAVHTLSKRLTLVANGLYLCIEYTGKKYEVH